MTLFRIPCVWSLYGAMYIDAESIDEAIKKAIEDEPLPRGEYLTDSFEIDEEEISPL